MSQGYWRDPGLTERAFVADPQFPGGRLYQTGDLARMDANGLVYFLGRRSDAILSDRELVAGYRIRVYSLKVPPKPGRFGRIFRCSTQHAAPARSWSRRCGR